MTHPVYSGVFEARHCTEMSPNVANTRVLLEAKIYSTVCSWCLKLKFSGIYILTYIVFCIFGFERHGLWMLVSLIPRLRYVQPRLKTTRKLPSLEPAHTVLLFQTSSLVVHPGLAPCLCWNPSARNGQQPFLLMAELEMTPGQSKQQP